ncbi:MAG: sn-glycerol-3-phosphate ABC transporter ATP-binding protein UgpC [Candidatus Korobacteraceae bacterium]
MASINFDRVVKRFGNVTVVPELSLEISDGEFLVFVGPSGCGKTTLLRMIAGLERIDEGTLRIGGDIVNEMPPARRNIAMVFQDYALYPHMSVRQNLSFGLENQKLPAAEIACRVTQVAAMLQIEPYLDRRPKALSGGQRQRVAMGRAMVRQPRAFLFDEPLSNLDAKLRVDVRGEIKKLFHELRTTTVFVTHDQVEAMTMADRIVVLEKGAIQQVGTPAEVYNRPANLFVAGFIGTPTMNFIPLHRSGNQWRWGQRLLELPPRADANTTSAEAVLGLRPEHWAVTRESDQAFVMRVEITEPLGSDTFIFGKIEEQRIVARLGADAPVAPGDLLPLRPDLERAHLFDAATGEILPRAAFSRP